MTYQNFETCEKVKGHEDALRVRALAAEAAVDQLIAALEECTRNMNVLRTRLEAMARRPSP